MFLWLIKGDVSWSCVAFDPSVLQVVKILSSADLVMDVFLYHC